MNLVDLAILFVLAISVIVGLVQGFVRSLSALAGLALGLTLACWNYERPAKVLLPMVRSRELANAIGFLFIALLVMVLLGFIGSMFARALRFLGLGWIDRICGAGFGLLEGAGLVAACIIVTIAFFPRSQWMAGSTLTPMFFSICDEVMEMSPVDMAKRVREGLGDLQIHAPRWVEP